jgi:hypothetical protein
MKNIIILLTTCIVVLLSINNSSAQVEQDSTLYNIETVDGNEFLGIIIFEDLDSIQFKTQSFGVVTIQKRNLKKMTKVEEKQMVKGEYWFENPQSTRYFFGTNGYSLRAGEGYYQNVWILFNQVAIGITDNLSIGAGIVPLFFFAGTSTPVWITPRFSIPVSKDQFNIGGGALIGTVIGENNSGFGVIYGNATIGSRNKNLNVGLGWGYAGSGGLAKSPTITLSSMIRTGKRGYFITENYYIDTGDEKIILISAGGRRIIKRVSLDFGLIIPFVTGQDIFIAIPWLGIAVPFGKKKNTKK